MSKDDELTSDPIIQTANLTERSGSISGGRPAKNDLDHPSRRLKLRSRGFGIGAGYERTYRGRKAAERLVEPEIYGPLPPAGYYGTGTADRPFKQGEATFRQELSWYTQQYGNETSGYTTED